MQDFDNDVIEKTVQCYNKTFQYDFWKILGFDF